MKSLLIGAAMVACAAIATPANALPIGNTNADVAIRGDTVLVKGGHGHGRGHHMRRGGRGHHYGWARGRGHRHGWHRGHHRW